MAEKTRGVLAVLEKHAEDAALSVGAVLFAVGIGCAFGYAFGLVAIGALLIAYGTFITGRRQQ
jgi:hypothetical protein